MAPDTTPSALVIGGTGAIGRRIVAHLQQADIDIQGIGSADIDLTRPDAPTLLAKMPRRQAWIIAQRARGPNHEMTTYADMVRHAATVADGIRQARPQQAILLGSTAVYDDETEPGPRSETSTLRPRNAYGLAKLHEEHLIGMACEEAGTRPIVLRTPMVYGLLSLDPPYGPDRFIMDARVKRPFTLYGDGSERRSYIHVDDLADIVLRSLRLHASGTMNVAAPPPMSFFELGATVAKALGIPVNVTRKEPPRSKVDMPIDASLMVQTFPEFEARRTDEGLHRIIEELTAPAPPTDDATHGGM